MTTQERLCPLCDAYTAAELCPTHRVPTIGPTIPGQPIARLEPGTVIAARYRLDKLLGQGGMGLIFQSTHLSTNEIVVLKLLKDESLSQRTYLRRFYQEARAITRLNHPNIVRIVEFGFDAPARVPFLVMEHVGGITLRELVCAEGPLGVERSSTVILQVARALLEAHDKGVLHRDLKPDNIMVRASPEGIDEVKVLDFGLAKLLEGDETTPPLTVPGRIVGTPSYMAPEQVVHGVQDFRTDLYGLGCVFHAVLLGRAPFSGGDRLDVMRRKVREPPPTLPGKLRSGEVPSDPLRALHRALLATNRLDRPKSTQEVVSALAGIAEDAKRGVRPNMALLVAAKTEIETDPRGKHPQSHPQPPVEAKHGVPDLDTMPATLRAGVAILDIDEGSLSSEEMVSDAEMNTLRAVLALDENVIASLNAEILERKSAPSLTPPIADPQAETLVHPVENRALLAEVGRRTDDDVEAWTSVLPSSLEPEQNETPTPLMKASTEPFETIDRRKAGPPARRRAQPPVGFRAGVALAALSAVTGAVLAVAVLKIRPIQPAVDPTPKRSAAAVVPATAEPIAIQPIAIQPVAAQPATDPSPPAGVAVHRTESVSIESTPEHADVYDGRVFLGTTPLMFLLPQGQEKVLRLEKRGYEDGSLKLDGTTKDRVVVELKSTAVRTKRKTKRSETAKVPVW
jgi:serine/threonine protein kinase